MPATHSTKYNSIDDFVRNFSPPIEGSDAPSIARLREPIKQMIPTTHLLNRPFMIERGLDIHPSSSVAWLGGNCNELTSIYNNLDDFEELNDGKVFAQFAHQLHCIPFVQSRQDNVLIITPMWSAIEGLADVYIKSKTLEKSLNALQDHTWPESMKSAFKVSMDLVADRDKIADPRWMFITLAIPWHDAKEQWGDTAIPAHFCRWFSLDGKEITFKLKNEHQYERREEP